MRFDELQPLSLFHPVDKLDPWMPADSCLKLNKKWWVCFDANGAVLSKAAPDWPVEEVRAMFTEETI